MVMVVDMVTRYIVFIVMQMLWCWRTLPPRLLVTSREDLPSPTYLACHSQGSPSPLPSCQFLHQDTTKQGGRGLTRGDTSHQLRGSTIPGWGEGGEEEEDGEEEVEEEEAQCWLSGTFLGS